MGQGRPGDGEAQLRRRRPRSFLEPLHPAERRMLPVLHLDPVSEPAAAAVGSATPERGEGSSEQRMRSKHR